MAMKAAVFFMSQENCCRGASVPEAGERRSADPGQGGGCLRNGHPYL